MKRGAIILLMAAVAVQGAVTSSTTEPETITEGQEATLTFTKQIDGLTDGQQTGSVTPTFTGPTGTFSLATQNYDFASLDPENRTLEWQWLPNAPGEYTLDYVDSTTEGPSTSQTVQVTVLEASLPPLTWMPSFPAYDGQGQLTNRNWGGFTVEPGETLASDFLKLHNDGNEPQTYRVRFLDDAMETRYGNTINLVDNLRFLTSQGTTPGQGAPIQMDGLGAIVTVPPGTTWLQYEIVEAPQTVTTAQYTAPFSITRLR